MKIFSLMLMIWCVVGIEKKHRHRRKKPQNLNKLESLVNHFREEYSHPINTHLEIMDDKTYEHKKAVSEYIKTFDIE
jgi:hypothetical protein